MKKTLSFAAVTLCLFLFSNPSFATPAKGAETIMLKGGTRGDVNFPHGIHQGITVDCMPCHGLLPKEPKIMGTMKDEGKLKKKEVMNMCKNCHRDLASKGQKAGPTSCSGCHKN